MKINEFTLYILLAIFSSTAFGVIFTLTDPIIYREFPMYISFFRGFFTGIAFTFVVFWYRSIRLDQREDR